MCPWSPNIPQSADIPAQSQALILGNFQTLDPIVNGINNFLLLPEQGSGPATGATQMALYTKHVGATTAMFLRNNTSGTEVNFTTCGASDPGWCILPCGILMKWFNIAAVDNGTTYNYPIPAGTPVFSAVYHAQVTTEYTGTSLAYPVCVQAFGVASITLRTKNGSGDSGANVFVIGIPV